MEKRADKIRAFILESIPEHPKDIVATTAATFSVSRTTVHRHLNRLIRDKKIIKSGTTRKATYFLYTSKNKTFEARIEPGTDENKIWVDNFQQDFASLNDNVSYICNYGFTEIFNNAIDHSLGALALAETKWSEDAVEICILDNGIGIFKKIKTALNLKDERYIVLTDLTK